MLKASFKTTSFPSLELSVTIFPFLRDTLYDKVWKQVKDSRQQPFNFYFKCKWLSSFKIRVSSLVRYETRGRIKFDILVKIFVLAFVIT